MKLTKISEFQITPENYEVSHYERANWQTVFSQMSPIER